MTDAILEETERLADAFEAGDYETDDLVAIAGQARLFVNTVRELQEQLDYARELTCLTTVVGCGECQLCTVQRELAQTRRELTETKLSLEGAMDASAEGSWMARALDAERELKTAQALQEDYARSYEAMIRTQNDAILDFDAKQRELEDLRKEYNEALRLLATRVEASRLTEANEQIAACNETIDMLYERTRRFGEQADKYEKETRVLRDNIQWMVDACKYDCKPGSCCGICHMGLTALGLENEDGVPTAAGDEELRRRE